MCYSPKIKEELVRKLYLLKHSTDKKTPMTKMVNEAIEEYLSKKGGDCNEVSIKSSQALNQNNF